MNALFLVRTSDDEYLHSKIVQFVPAMSASEAVRRNKFIWGSYHQKIYWCLSVAVADFMCNGCQSAVMAMHLYKISVTCCDGDPMWTWLKILFLKRQHHFLVTTLSAMETMIKSWNVWFITTLFTDNWLYHRCMLWCGLTFCELNHHYHGFW